MLNFRKHIAAKLMALMTGIIFLNMSFFLTEIKSLDLHLSHAKMVENVVKALAGVGFEEEKDSMGESSGTEASHTVDLHMNIHPITPDDSFQNTSNLFSSRHNIDVAESEAEILTPPPKVS